MRKSKSKSKVSEIEIEYNPIYNLLAEKFLGYMEFHHNRSNGSFEDLERWMEYREAYFHNEIIPLCQAHNIVYYPADKNSMVALTPQFETFLIRQFPAILRMLLSFDRYSIWLVIFAFVIAVARYIGMSLFKFVNLPTIDPEFCSYLFDMSYLVWTRVDYYDAMKKHEDQRELLEERREFKKKINKKG